MNITSSKATIFGSSDPTVARFPVVRFDYPDSTTDRMRERFLLVVEANADYIKGNELESAASKKIGPYKAFLRNRIAQNGVSLCTF